MNAERKRLQRMSRRTFGLRKRKQHEDGEKTAQPIANSVQVNFCLINFIFRMG
jgi:hypothetical protein